MGTHKDRQKLSLRRILNLFPDDQTAETWFIQARWSEGIQCPLCESKAVTERTTKRRSWRCKECRKDFSTRTGTLMQSSNLSFQTWAIAIYLLTTNVKGVASTKLGSDLNVTQKTAWHLAMRIRETYQDRTPKQLSGTVEVDETYIGGKDRNKHAQKQTQDGRAYGVKHAVVGMKSRKTKTITAQVIDPVSAITLQGFAKTHTETGQQVYTDQHRGYHGLRKDGFDLTQVNHSVKEYVRDMAHTNGIESFWALLKRGYYGTHHFMSPQHLGRYVTEFAGRHNRRPLDTLKHMTILAQRMAGKQFPYKTLVM